MAGHLGVPHTAVVPPTTPWAAKLITADPALALVERWRVELTVLRRRSPGSDAVATLTDCVRELVDAINAGHDVSVQLTLVEAHALSHIPVSTLRWICNHKPDSIGARKRAGVWYIDRARFEAYLAAPSHRARPPHANAPRVTDPNCRPAPGSVEEVA